MGILRYFIMEALLSFRQQQLSYEEIREPKKYLLCIIKGQNVIFCSPTGSGISRSLFRAFMPPYI